MRFELIIYTLKCIALPTELRRVLVPRTGLEPARPFGQQILSLSCLPIPSSWHPTYLIEIFI